MVIQVNYDQMVKQAVGEGKDNWVTVGIDMHTDKWQVGMLNRQTGKYSNFCYRDQGKEAAAYGKLSELLGKGFAVDVCYEAGRCGFTAAREMAELGVNVSVIPVGKLEVIQSGKKVKTDKLDSRFYAYVNPRDPWLPKVYVPTEREECDRMLLREEKRLSDDVARKNNQILAIIERWPIVKHLEGRGQHLPAREWRAHLRKWREQGRLPACLPEVETKRLGNLIAELELLEKQSAEWSQEMAKRIEAQRQEAARAGQPYVVDVIRQYRGFGESSAVALTWMIADFERFKNGKQFASFFGLTPTPWASNKRRREQGISKAGDGQLRRLAIELAWLWVRWQPNSKLTQKWLPKLQQKGRVRRMAIVALARQLMVAVYRLVVHGEEIQGAVKNVNLEA